MHRVSQAARAPEQRYHGSLRVLAHRLAGGSIGLALACGVGEPAPSPARDPVLPAAPEAPAPVDVAPTEPSPRSGGLTRLAREMIDEARREAADPLALVPESAQWVALVRPAEFLAHSEFRSLWSKAEESNDDFRTVLAVMRTCMGGVEAIEHMVLGFDDQGHMAMIGRAKGLGTEATWRCLREEAAARGKPLEFDLTGTPRGEGPQLRESGKTNGEEGYLVDDDTVVMVSKEWVTDVRARLRNEGTAASDGRLRPTIARVDANASAWLVGRIEGLPATMLAGGPMASIVDMSLSLRVRDGDLELRLEADAGEPADATRVRDELTKQFELFKGVLPTMGFPASVPTKIVFETEGDLVSMHLSLTADEFRGLRESIERTL
ncbi:hypothetical protein [Paraliomyxa miuraensis]|uniref:hypothetical protein n=1 Tax=Paraliomyxa miuraensis TaxID=376150 RepID=UPI0022563C04|nr:hypothetical protein [Paraliomyxa miuraensis]MCX4246987.1 hypothetical protein [Paraliomyxa miuraensis]